MTIGSVTPQLAAAAIHPLVRELDGAWSTCPITLRRARVLELPGWAFYVAGRGGVLGDDARPEAVAAALGVIAPDAVRAGWEAARKVGPAAVAASRLVECARWGDERLTSASGLTRLVGLAERVVAAADAGGLPLFAAARAMPAPDGGVGARAALAIHLLREYRAGALLLAVRASGLTPIESLIAGPDGEEEAVAFGWDPPYPARALVMRRFILAEALADRITGQGYAALSADERAELVGHLRSAAETPRPVRVNVARHRPGTGAVWTEERSDEGRRRIEGPEARASEGERQNYCLGHRPPGQA